MSFPPIVALEVGTGMVRAVVGEVNDDGHLMITGVGEVASAGVRKGEIVDYEQARQCVSQVLQMAEDNSQVLIRRVHLVLTGGHITSVLNRGTIHVMNPHREITEEEKERVREVARAVPMPPDRVVLHTIIQRYQVDDHDGVVDPKGLEGSKLSVDMLIVHGIASRMRNVVKVVRDCDVDVADVAFAGLCSALAVLTPEEKESGVILMDIGAGTTDFVVYADNAIAFVGCLPLGGDHITNDLACGLHISTGEAEHLKLTHGNATADLSLRSKKVAVVPQTVGRERIVRVADVHTIIQARMEEILELVKKRTTESGYYHRLGSGVVVTGGTARLPDLSRLVERVWRLPCRIGKPRGVGGLNVITEATQYSAPVGMLKYAQRTIAHDEYRLSRLLRKLLSWE